jgi:putative tryptophan/tyrosine transport system substrate-binding protein
VWPLSARAQQPAKIARIGFLGSSSPSDWASRMEALRSGLRDLGYVEGKNIVIEFRWAEGNYDRHRDLVDELLRLKLDILLAHGTPGTLAAKQATTTVPIVMVHSGDAVANGIVGGLSRPGGNITGTTFFVPELMAKRIELLKEVNPRINQMAVLWNPDNPAKGPSLGATEKTAKSLKVVLHHFDVRGPNEFDGVFSAMTKRSVDAVVIWEDVVSLTGATAIAELAKKTRLPSAGFSEFAAAGGMIGYGANYLAMYRRAAFFVDKILKGAKPADIPVEQPTKFDLVINLKTAKALGLTVPDSLLVQATEVIE